MQMRRIMTVLALSLAVWGWPVTGGHADTLAPKQPATANGSLRADFNNDGIADLAVGVPFEDTDSGVVDAGAVNVQYGSATGLTTSPGQIFTQAAGLAEAGDLFGFALTTGDFNNDGIPDLAAGAPGEDVGSVPDAGAFSVLYGSPSGLTTSNAHLFTQVGSAAEPNDLFGFSLAAGDFNNDGADDVAVGAPLESKFSTLFVGAVSVLYGSGSGGLSTVGGQLFTQVAGAVEPDDSFGYALAAGDFNSDGVDDLAAGAPFEDVGSVFDAGAFSVLYGSPGGLSTVGGQLFTQVGDEPEPGDSFGSSLAAGDFDNDTFDDLAAGAPFESVGSAFAAGAVSILYGMGGGLSTAGGQFFTQVAGLAEPADIFGFSLANGDFNNDNFDDLAAGAPLEDVGSVFDAGAFSVLNGSASGAGGGPTPGHLFTQLGSAPENNDLFGYALTTGNFNNDGFDDVAAGAPNEGVFSIPGAGAVSVLNGPLSSPVRGQIITQDSPGVGSSVETDDAFGYALAAAIPAPASATPSSVTRVLTPFKAMKLGHARG